ncbi:SDR family oxidoreductase [Jinshanibacter sp. LJY008]|uniref:SDR family oxidoreductase n=1 Tax=Limnobaculum eriocheiris TaxID=2897391 RepID=A0A9X1MTL3_9GAMM|nr:SDR family oxidoreductase [Limnobaculum eriocheiris]MCD1124784.1 SDR family oxidoreductase [Limnobaculum eriocheiris]
MDFTIFGGNGFIGSVVVKYLINQGYSVWIPERNDSSIFIKNLGVVIYCAGNGDCVKTPFNVYEANVNLLSELLQKANFSKLLYISSTRIYMNNVSANENDDIRICVNDSRRLFNLTKLLAEELCLRSSRDVFILRPSNVYGITLNSPLFLPTITRNAINNGKVDMYVPMSYSKDYVSVDDVALTTILLAKNDIPIKEKIINVASGYNVSAKEIADILHKKTNCEIIWHDIDFAEEYFPRIEVDNLLKYIPEYNPRKILDDLNYMIDDFKSSMKNNL